MTLAAPALRRRMPGRFLTAVGVVLLLQIVLIYWLSDRSPALPGQPTAAPAFQLGDPGPDAALMIEDPTLFVLPRRESFSGAAWMAIPRQTFRSENWSDPPRWLDLTNQDLGAAFVQYVRNDALPSFQTVPVPRPDLLVPAIAPVRPVSVAAGLRLEGDLASRRLISPPDLPPRPGSDLLTNSIVQVTVDAQGHVFSAVLRDPSGGSERPAHDKEALRIANQLRFEPIDVPGPARTSAPAPSLTVGTLVFHWETIPTNAAPSSSIP